MQPVASITQSQVDAFVAQLGLVNPKISDYTSRVPIKVLNCTARKVEMAAGGCIKIDGRNIQKPNHGYDGSSYGLEAHKTFDFEVWAYEATCLALQETGNEITIIWAEVNNPSGKFHKATFQFEKEIGNWNLAKFESQKT